MKVEFHSLHWNNVDKDMIQAHKRVMGHFNIPMNYHNLHGVGHGGWLDNVISSADSDVVVVFEPDCIPLNKNFINYIKYVQKNDTFIGIAQVSNHIPPRSHIYAAPGFFCIRKTAYDRLGRPSFSETKRSDVGEELCYIAEERNVKYRALMPTYFEKESTEGLWYLSNLGYYGIGTVFDDSIYHLYQSRMAENIELFIKRCEEVINGNFTTSNFNKATTFNYEKG